MEKAQLPTIFVHEEQPDLRLHVTPAMNPLTRYHREAMANLLNGKPVLPSIGERMEKAQLPTIFVHEEQSDSRCTLR
jgi:hypothetical protein